MHAVGSVIDVQGGKFVVCGFRPFENDGTVGMGYLVVPYPLGFVNVDSFSLVSSDADYPVVHEGYRNKDAESYDNTLELARGYGRETSLEEVLAANDEAMAELWEMADKMAGEE